MKKQKKQILDVLPVVSAGMRGNVYGVYEDGTEPDDSVLGD